MFKDRTKWRRGKLYTRPFWRANGWRLECGLVVWTGDDEGGKVARNYMLFCFHYDRGWPMFVIII